MLHIDDAYKPILDREAAVEMAGKFPDAIELLLELVDYGTKLIPRAYDSSDHGLKAICLVFVQLRQFISHLDGITTLLHDGDCATANLQLRSLLETAHLMEWILSTDTDEKIKHLYVANLRRRRHWDRIIIPGTTEATNHAAVASLLKLEPQQIQEIKDEVTRIDSLLGQPEFNAINAKFEVFYSKHGFDKPWYDVYGVSSIRKVSEEINKLGEYKYIYSSLSGVTHGGDMWRSVFFDKDHVKVSPISRTATHSASRPACLDVGASGVFNDPEAVSRGRGGEFCSQVQQRLARTISEKVRRSCDVEGNNNLATVFLG